MQLSRAITLQISRVKPGNPRREGGKKGGREGRVGGRDVMAIMGPYGVEWVHNREPKRSRVTS